MFLFDWFRSFLPLHNPIGFGASDFIELALAVLLVLLILARGWIEPAARKLAEQTGACMILLGALAVILRMALLPSHPVPTPNTSDDFSYLLLADTLRHFRLANPPHPLPQFFETFFVLQDPTYSSIFPIGQGLVLAIGRAFFGNPWAGVVLSMAAFCALCYWMLRAWVAPQWALAGGLLCVMQFGPLNRWMNLYWGGAVSAIAGCLVFGSLPRLRERPRLYGGLIGLGISLQLISRPYECIFLVCSAALWAAVGKWPKPAASAALLAIMPAAGLTLLQNKQVTGSWTTLPYELSRYEYGVPATFTFEPNPVPHRNLTPWQQLDYQAQSDLHGTGPEMFGRYTERLGYRVRFFRFFLYPPLYLALAAFLVLLREWRFAWVAFTILLFSLGANFYPYFYPHYVAAITCLFVLASVAGLARLSRWPAGREAVALILLVCATHFLFWYGFQAAGNSPIPLSARQYETWDFVNFGDPGSHGAITSELSSAPGQQLVFVRYYPAHMFDEWVQNAADIDGSRVVWALDLGPEENEKLLRYYPGRTPWLLEPDFRPPRLRQYR